MEIAGIAKTTGAGVAVVGVLPRGSKYLCSKVDELNTLLAHRCELSELTYVDIHIQFWWQGDINRQLYFSDSIYLNVSWLSYLW